jgi:hypothetical protein
MSSGHEQSALFPVPTHATWLLADAQGVVYVLMEQQIIRERFLNPALMIQP